MKRVLLSILIAFIAVATYANPTANETDVSTFVITEVAYTLDLGDVTDLSDQELSYEIDRGLNELMSSSDELECSVMVKAKVGTSGTGAEIEVRVTGPCDKVREKAKKILQEMVEEARELL